MSRVASAPAFDAASLREREFPALEEAIYLNAASVAPTPERTRRAVHAHNERRSRVHLLDDPDFSVPLRRSRAAAARLIGAEPEEIALGWNTSFGINLAALSLPMEPGSSIVVSDREFPANVYPWMARKDARVEVVPTDARGHPDEERLLERLRRGGVSVFALSHVQFATGWRADLARFGEVCREEGIHFVVDAIQSLGQIPLDVREAGIDVLAAGGHKWLCSPFGTGFAFVRRGLLEAMEPAVVGWTGLTSSADFNSLVEYRWEFREDARRFEVATLPVQDFAGFAESVELLLEVGVDRIERQIRWVLEPLMEWLAAHPEVEVASDLDPARRSGIVAFRPPEPERVFGRLRGAGVGCVLREGAIRFSPHLYNSREEMERVIEILKRSGEESWR
jgi:cysteine desulfurase / selenocysteine lyase